MKTTSCALTVSRMRLATVVLPDPVPPLMPMIKPTESFMLLPFADCHFRLAIFNLADVNSGSHRSPFVLNIIIDCGDRNSAIGSVLSLVTRPSNGATSEQKYRALACRFPLRPHD